MKQQINGTLAAGRRSPKALQQAHLSHSRPHNFADQGAPLPASKARVTGKVDSDRAASAC